MKKFLPVWIISAEYLLYSDLTIHKARCTCVMIFLIYSAVFKIPGPHFDFFILCVQGRTSLITPSRLIPWTLWNALGSGEKLRLFKTSAISDWGSTELAHCLNEWVGHRLHWWHGMGLAGAWNQRAQAMISMLGVLFIDWFILRGEVVFSVIVVLFVFVCLFIGLGPFHQFCYEPLHEEKYAHSESEMWPSIFCICLLSEPLFQGGGGVGLNSSTRLFWKEGYDG